MKKLFLMMVIFAIQVLLYSQTPEQFKYQTVARDIDGHILDNQLVSFQLSILFGSTGGPSVYTETHQTTTNDFGVAILEIGSGTTSDDFSSIDWSTGPYYLQVEMDPSGSTSYQLMGTSQLVSVPYALYSEATGDTTRWNKNSNDLYYINGNIGIGTSTPDAPLEVSGRISQVNTGNSVFIGESAGTNDDLSYNNNVFIGYESGIDNNIGYNNTALGAISFTHNLDGYGNTSIGAWSMQLNTEGIQNSTLGYHALENNISGSNNVAIGSRALENNGGAGNNNTAIGYSAGRGFGSPYSGCVFIGSYAGYSETTDNKLYIENSDTVAPLIYGEFDNDLLAVNGRLGVGTQTPSAPLEVVGRISQIGTGGSVYIGEDAGLNDGSTSNYNVFIGHEAGIMNDGGQQNTGVGNVSLSSNISGARNTGLGGYSLNSNESGNDNTGVGESSLLELLEGNRNCALGVNSQRLNISGDYNTSVGYESNYFNETGNNNTAVGYQAGFGSFESSHSGCVYLGYRAGYYNTADHKLYIENSNSTLPLIYGEFDNDILAVNGNLGIGTHTPDVRLHVINGSDATITGGGYLVTGNTTGTNIVLDENEIMARNNGSTSTLQLQRDGGAFSVHYGLGELNEFRILDDGKIGIGENGPSSKLHINTSAAEDGLRLQINGATKLRIPSNGGVVVGYNNSAPTYALQLLNSSSAMEGWGAAYAWYEYSDNRVKSNQGELIYGLKEVMQLQPKSYDHHSSSTNEEGEFIMVTDQKASTVGFIAQEVQKIIPEAVNEPQDDSKNLWAMDYNKLIPVLTKAIQEQQEMIEKLHKRIEILENR